jgi:hypothetical protein
VLKVSPKGEIHKLLIEHIDVLSIGLPHNLNFQLVLACITSTFAVIFVVYHLRSAIIFAWRSLVVLLLSTY